jgi:putative ABC transport system permease protein
MFGYYLDLALRSLRRTPVLTGLMVLAIGLGIGASMTMLTVLHVMSGDPLPERSGHLFYPTLDPRPLHEGQGERSSSSNGTMGADRDMAVDNFTYVDAMALLQTHRAPRQAAMAGGSVLVQSADPHSDAKPEFMPARYASVDFFALFDVPMRSGRVWNALDDEQRAHVAVITPQLQQRLFGNGDAVGQSLLLKGNVFTVIGVTGAWAPQPTFYQDVDSGRPFGHPDQVFIPFLTAVDLGMPVNGTSCWGKDNPSGKARYTSGACAWVQFWVQLDDAAQVSDYRQFLQGYAASQHQAGRFERPATSELYPMMDWLGRANWVPGDLRLQMTLALAFLFVCMLNIVALLLAKFLRRSGEISVRRAMGARRRDIFVQLGIEAALIGVAGGLLGLLIAQLGLWSVRQRPDDYASLAQMDSSMLFGTLILAIIASVLAGLLPAWRACHVPPGLQLKSA